MILMAAFVPVPVRVIGIAGIAIVALHNVTDLFAGPAGYAFGTVRGITPDRRRAFCLRLGVALTVGFVLLRAINLYGDPRPSAPGRMPLVLAFLNTTKYPASLSFLLMTLGPTTAIMPVLERARGRVARWITVFGRVPFFYYVLHIPLIHLLALVVSGL